MSDRTIFSFDWALWFQWVVATTLGWIVGGFLVAGIDLLATGIAVGVLQGFILQPRIARAWRWMLATAIGWAVGALIIIGLLPDALDFLGGVILGLTCGFAQWLILRENVHWAGWWMPISIAGWTTGFTLLPGLFLTGMLAGAVTGVALELLLRYPKQIKSSPTN